MWKERLKRILIIAGVAGLVVFASRVFAKKPISLPTDQITQKIQNLGEEILGTAINVLPGNNNFKKQLKNKPTTSQGEVAGETTTKSEPVKQIENQAQEIIETLKGLPAEQLEQIKKQIFKDFCQSVLGENK